MTQASENTLLASSCLAQVPSQSRSRCGNFGCNRTNFIAPLAGSLAKPAGSGLLVYLPVFEAAEWSETKRH